MGARSSHVHVYGKGLIREQTRKEFNSESFSKINEFNSELKNQQDINITNNDKWLAI